MLQKVVDDYLERVRERQFDLPFLSLIRKIGYSDIHYTHGQAEFGKDFIAKRIDDGQKIQYSFQLKAGDIGQREWRNEIMPQMLECLTNRLSHPSFDQSLPHQSVLVLTGRLTGNAPVAVQDFDRMVEEQLGLLSIDVWDEQTLFSKLSEYGFGGNYVSSAGDFDLVGSFFGLYGQAVRGMPVVKDIEAHLAAWMTHDMDADSRLLATIEAASILSSLYDDQGFLYESLVVTQCMTRAVLSEVQRRVDSQPSSIDSSMVDALSQARNELSTRCAVYFEEFVNQWSNSGHDLARLTAGVSPIKYNVHCARAMEVAGYL